MDKVFNFLVNVLNLKDDDLIVVANSGGPDSMALTNILLTIQKKIKIKIICAHVNHNVRKESEYEAEFLRNFCKDNNIAFEYMKIEKYGDDNFHNEARNIRYLFFEKVVRKYNAQYLMTAHHGDDLIETILMRIVRGTSLKGYGGFKKIVNKDGYKLARPLVYVTKDEIISFNESKKIPFVIDSSNCKTKYTRNRYRKILLPFLKNEDKNVHEKFIKFSDMIFEHEDFIDRQTMKVIKKIYIDNILNIDMYKREEKIIQYRVLSKMLEEFYSDDLILINNSHMELIHKLIYSNKKNSFVMLPNNVYVNKTYNILEIKRLSEDIYDYEIELDDYTTLPNKHSIELVIDEISNDNNVCRLSRDDVMFPLYVRTRRNGDKIYLKKIEGSRKLKDIFIDCKIPIKERDIWPVVVDSRGKIIWIPGIKKSKFTKSKDEKCDIILKYK